jgi:Predicted membrane protein
MERTTTKSKQLFTTNQMVIIALLSALSYVLMLIPLPFKYLGFLELELSDIPAIVAGIAYGPMAGVVIELIKNLIKAITASTTGGIGELANFIIICAYIVPAAWLFRKGSGKWKAVIAFVTGIIGFMIAGILVNYFVTVPLYAKLFGGMENVVGFASKTIPAIHSLATIVILGITPFNVVKGIMISVVGYYTYHLTRRYIR